MILQKFNRIAVASAVLASLVSCVDDIAGKDISVISGEGDEERVEVNIDFSGAAINVVESKSALLSGAENVHSGAVIYACIVRDGIAQIDNYMVVSGEEVSAPGHNASTAASRMKLVNGAVYDFYVVGNAWFIDKGSGQKKEWAAVMGQDMPVRYADGLANIAYRFDGSDFRSGYRHETLAEVKTYGIPYSGSKKSVQIHGGGQDVTIDNCRYLFAKLSFTVDHTGLDGNLNDGYFKNRKVYLRQANPVIFPFASKNVLSGESIGADCDEAMTNGHSETYTLYVPENCQGDLLSTTDPALKSADNPALSNVKDKLTYIEFQGTVNPSNVYAAQIGYSGNVTYRFYLGSDNCKNFDVEGGKDYRVTMGFTVDKIFNPAPLWRVETDSFTDGRYLDVMKDAACAKPLGTSFVGVRKNRGNTVYVYVNKEGKAGSSNAILGKDPVGDPSAYSATDVTDCSISFSPSPASLLADFGINAFYDKNTCALCFSVGNPARFEAFRVGAGQVDLTVTLLPSVEGTKTRTFTIKALEDMELVLPSGDIYIGQKTSVCARGFCGTPRLASSVGTVFRTTNVAGTDKYLSATPVEFTDGKIDLYAYNYNGGSDFNLTVSSDDDFNDGTTVKSVCVRKPRLGLSTAEVDLGIDGTEVELGVGYYPEDGSTSFPEGTFDADVYAQVLAPVFTLRETFKRPMIGFENSTVFFCDLPPTPYPNTRTLFGSVDVCGRNASLFPKPVVGVEYTKVYYRYPSVIVGFSDITNCDLFNIDTQEAAENRKLETLAQVDLAFCRNPFNGDGTNWYSVDVGEDYGSLNYTETHDNGSPHMFITELSGTTVTVHWYVKPQKTGGSINAPWGRRSVHAMFRNKHSGSSYLSYIGAFEIRYNPVVLNKLCVYPVYDKQKKFSNADCYICCNLAAMLYTPGKQAPATFDNFTSLPIGGRQFTDDHYTDNTVTEGVTGHTDIYLRYVAWALRSWNGIRWGSTSTPSPLDGAYSNACWYEEMAAEAIRTGHGQLTDCYFFYGGAHENTLRWESYPMSTNEEKQKMQYYVPVCIGDPRTVSAFLY